MFDQMRAMLPKTMEDGMVLFIIVFALIAAISLAVELVVTCHRRRTLAGRLDNAKNRTKAHISVMYTNCAVRTIVNRREFLDRECVNPARENLGDEANAQEFCRGCPHYSSTRIRKLVPYQED